MDFLTEKILQRDATAIEMAKQLGSVASQNIRPLTAHGDPIVREIALRCLNQSGGGNLSDVFINALSDRMPTVRAAALNGLRRHFSEDTAAKLLRVYSEISDPQHRKEIALLVGRLGNANVEDLRRLFRDELSAEARQGGLAALAKLGDPQARREFLERLQQVKNRELKELLDLVDYIKQLWTLRGLMAVLGDQTPLAGSGFCRIIADLGNGETSSAIEPAASRDRIAEILRACDIAVNLIKKISGAKFPFPTGAKNYTDAELAAARQILAAIFSQQR